LTSSALSSILCQGALAFGSSLLLNLVRFVLIIITPITPFNLIMAGWAPGGEYYTGTHSNVQQGFHVLMIVQHI
jgi:hypothetical protein